MKELKAPIHVQWELTNLCNKKCIHCYNYWRNESDFSCKSNIDHLITSKIVEDLINNEIFHVVLTGGEPLIVFEEMFPYLKKLKDNNISFSINTNMALFSESIAKKLHTLGIKSILCSFPANSKQLDERITGTESSFRNTVCGIKLAIKMGFKITVNMVITKLNYNNIYETAKYCKNMGVSKFCVTKALPPSNSTNFEKYEIDRNQLVQIPHILIGVKNKLKIDVGTIEAYPFCIFDDIRLLAKTGFTKTCKAGESFCTVSSDGEYRACFFEKSKYGKNLYESWRKIGENAKLFSPPQKCLKCKYLKKCNVGCHLFKVDNDMLNPFCVKGDVQNENNGFIENTIQIKNCSLCYSKAKYKFNKLIKTRRESFGGIFYLNINSWYKIDLKTYNFYIKYGNNVFTQLDFKKFTGFTSKESNFIFNYFIKKNIIKVCEYEIVATHENYRY